MPMVDENENMYYSIDVGPIHFIAFSTEHYFSLEDPFVGIQYEWFLNDLIQGTAFVCFLSLAVVAFVCS